MASADDKRPFIPGGTMHMDGYGSDARPELSQSMPAPPPSAARCPVCNGSGQYRPPTRSTIQLPPQRQCHGCQGAGWVSEHPLIAAMREALEALRADKALVTRKVEM